MWIDVIAVTDVGGGAGPFGAIGNFLLLDAASYGTSVRSVEVKLMCAPIPDPQQWQAEWDDAVDMPGLHEVDLADSIPASVVRQDYERARSALPTAVFRRSRGHGEITVCSALSYPRPQVEDRDLVAEFAQGVDEVIAALELLRTRLKSSDDFNLDGLLAHCRKARSRFPQSSSELEAVLEADQQAFLERWAGVSGWEALGIDWEEFHPTARELLDDPFFWDETDDHAPHGNDTGADVLQLYKAALADDAHLDTAAWTRQLLRSWGATDSELAALTTDEAWIAAAFAEMKFRGRTTPELANEARAAVTRLRDRPINGPVEPGRDSKLAKVAERLT